MRAGEEILYLAAVAGRALQRHYSRRWLRIVRRTVAAHASFGTEESMRAFRHLRRLVRMAGGAIHFGDALRMRKFPDIRMTGRAIQYAVNAGLLFCLIDVNAPARLGLQILIIVTGEAVRVGIRGGLGLCVE